MSLVFTFIFQNVIIKNSTKYYVWCKYELVEIWIEELASLYVISLYIYFSEYVIIKNSTKYYVWCKYELVALLYIPKTWKKFCINQLCTD